MFQYCEKTTDGNKVRSGMGGGEKLPVAPRHRAGCSNLCGNCGEYRGEAIDGNWLGGRAAGYLFPMVRGDRGV